jgi:hexosaminidase
MLPLLLARAAATATLAAAGNFCGSSAGCIYPLPQHATQGAPPSTGPPPSLNPQIFQTTCRPQGHPACAAVVVPALERMRGRIFTMHNGTQTAAGSLITELVVELSSTSAEPLQHGVNESYTLRVPAASAAMTATVSAANEWGALHGIESFAQSVALLSGTDHGFFPTAQRAYVLTLWPPARIVDSPRTAWRGLMIDTSRHFLSVPTIEKAITAMSISKMNVLHWHIVDGDGWALCINSTVSSQEKTHETL